MAVKDGNTVRVHYTGTFSDGEVFDSSREREPLEFTIGDGSLIPGFEDALLGHNAGDRFTVTIPADEAYGEHLEELLMEVPVSEVPEDIKPEVGMMLQIATDDGDMEVQIVEVNDKVVVLDANHPLAGEDLTFDIEVIDSVILNRSFFYEGVFHRERAEGTTERVAFCFGHQALEET